MKIEKWKEDVKEELGLIHKYIKRIAKVILITIFLLLILLSTKIVVAIYLRNQYLAAIKGFILPLNGNSTFSNAESKDIYVEYDLNKLSECIMKGANTGDSGYSVIKNFYQKNVTSPEDRLIYSLGMSGYYESDSCLAVYLENNERLTQEQVQEHAHLAEMLVRRAFPTAIRVRDDYHPSDHVGYISPTGLINKGFSEELSKSLFGIYDPETQQIQINENRINNFTLNDSWRLIHEVIHSFGSPHFYNPLTNPSNSLGVNPLNETITEYLTEVVVRRIDNDNKLYESPAMKALLTKVDKESLYFNYYNNTPAQIKYEVDGNSYDGALCTFVYYLDKLGPYGHNESDMYIRSLEDSSLRVDSSVCNFH